MGGKPTCILSFYWVAVVEWSNTTVCKTVLKRHAGSNPACYTNKNLSLNVF